MKEWWCFDEVYMISGFKVGVRGICSRDADDGAQVGTQGEFRAYQHM